MTTVDSTVYFDLGYAAYQNDELRTSNPFSDDTPEFQEYDAGWLWSKQTDNGDR